MKLQTQILLFLKQQPKTWAIKVEAANQRGCPDILCSVGGLFLAIEVKEGRDKLSPIQEAQIARICKTDGYVWCVNNFENFKNMFKQTFRHLKV